ncbi:MAG: AmmeMemoRadiSam system protein B [Bacteriovoracaceae bacterium]|jgi:MEMO1 family protein|nr:AmmeMemoRadiSam system protein B [Bacteriovoracaceae bacterium]
MDTVKKSNVAGSFYPENSEELKKLLDACDDNSIKTGQEEYNSAVALIAPHAGLVFSGPIAASGYQLLQGLAPKTIAILSPTHYFNFEGVATHGAECFETPLGKIEVNQPLKNELVNSGQVQIIDQVFEREHALEVHLPFLQKYLTDFSIVPLIVGRCSPGEIEKIIDGLHLRGAFIIISSDLSHFHSYDQAREQDSSTSSLIESCQFEKITGDDACGYYPLSGLLKWAQSLKFKVKAIDIRNSGDTAGDKDQVVGYGSYIVYK